MSLQFLSCIHSDLKRIWHFSSCCMHDLCIKEGIEATANIYIVNVRSLAQIRIRQRSGYGKLMCLSMSVRGVNDQKQRT